MLAKKFFLAAILFILFTTVVAHHRHHRHHRHHHHHGYHGYHDEYHGPHRHHGHHGHHRHHRHKQCDIAPLVSSELAQTIPDSYIVVFKKRVEKSKIESHHKCIHKFVAKKRKCLSKKGLLKDFIFGIDHIYDFKNFKGYSGRFSKEVLEKIRRSGEVAYIERDQVVYANEIQNNAPWGLARTSHRQTLSTSTYNKYLHDSQGGKDVTVYIIDTGINIDHEDFEGRAEWGVTIPQNSSDTDENGHGTHIAGTVAGNRFGLSKKAKLVAIKVLGSNGSGTMSDVIKGVEYATQFHIAEKDKACRENKPFKGSGANLSLGGGKSQTLNNAINNAVDAGLNFAVAAGGEDRDACQFSPASAEKAITAGSSNIEDERSWNSNHGPCVDVFAPGVDIMSTWIGSRSATNILSGTSMASSHVAGLIAYFLSLEPDSSSEFFTTLLTPEELKNKIIRLATMNVLSNVPINTPNRLIFNDFNESQL